MSPDMALSSSSTIRDALDQLNDNLDWEGSTSKAKDALEAIRFLKINRPTEEDDEDLSITYSDLTEMETELREYVNRVGAGRSKRASFVQGKPV